MDKFMCERIPLTFFILIVTTQYCSGDMILTQINPILSNSTSLSCMEFACRSWVEATIKCNMGDRCCGAWAEEDTLGGVSCGICSCQMTTQGFNFTEDIASKILLRSYEKFVKGNHDTFSYQNLT